ncbi:MAG: hypothetical protein V4760_11505 [Bdellovibrionota bacterium]
MGKNVIGTVTTLNRVSAILQNRLISEDEKQMKATGFPLTPREMSEKLEELRLEDLGKWNTKKSKAVLHHVLRAPN